jgi:aryl-alcohol dehydrogenase-like predicted oxidoreductase
LVDGEEQSVANDLVAKVYDRCIRYFDVAPTYGNAEERLGPALEPYRKESFLACKTTQRDKENSRKELEQFLKYLRTDHRDRSSRRNTIFLAGRRHGLQA